MRRQRLQRQRRRRKMGRRRPQRQNRRRQMCRRRPRRKRWTQQQMQGSRQTNRRRTRQQRRRRRRRRRAPTAAEVGVFMLKCTGCCPARAGQQVFYCSSACASWAWEEGGHAQACLSTRKGQQKAARAAARAAAKAAAAAAAGGGGASGRAHPVARRRDQAAQPSRLQFYMAFDQQRQPAAHSRGPAASPYGSGSMAAGAWWARGRSPGRGRGSDRGIAGRGWRLAGAAARRQRNRATAAAVGPGFPRLWRLRSKASHPSKRSTMT